MCPAVHSKYQRQFEWVTQAAEAEAVSIEGTTTPPPVIVALWGQPGMLASDTRVTSAL